MKLPGSLRWIALALLGLVIAGAVALAASRLASQQIGIAGESVKAGDSLAPPVTSVHPQKRKDQGTKGPEKSTRPTEGETPGGSELEPTTEPTETEPTSEPAETEPTESEPPGSSSTPSEDDGGGGGQGGGRDD